LNTTEFPSDDDYVRQKSTDNLESMDSSTTHPTTNSSILDLSQRTTNNVIDNWTIDSRPSTVSDTI